MGDGFAKKVLMAHYTELNVYRKAYQLFLETVIVSKNFQREYRYSIGEKLNILLSDLVLNIWKANRVDQKVQYIEQGMECVESFRLHIRLLHDLKQINIETMAKLNMMIEDVSRQLHGWYKSNLHNAL